MDAESGKRWSMSLSEDLGLVRSQLDWLLSVRLSGHFDLTSQHVYTGLCHLERDLLDKIETGPEYSIL
jgi:hypothetical protein